MMLIRTLLASICILALSPVAVQAQKSDEPTLEEAISFIRGRLMACGNMTFRTSAIGAAWNVKKDYRWSRFDLSGNVLFMERAIFERIGLPDGYALPEKMIAELKGDGYDIKYGSSGGRNYANGADKKLVDAWSAPLAELSPGEVVAKKKRNDSPDTEYMVEVRCRDAKCTSGGASRFNIEVCGGESEAQRIAKAMSHAIRKAGGKNAAF